MADWNTASLELAPLKPLAPPLQAVLVLMETVEAILEALLELVKVFLLDFSNPLTAAVTLLLAAIRAVINQIKSTGFSILLVHPDFSRQDFAAQMASVAGSYQNFESKVISKFFDQSDIARPQYGDGSSVAMLVFYIGTENPGDLLLQLYALLRLVKQPVVLTGLSAPVEVKVNPVRKSGDVVSNFRGLFDPDLSDALVVEWRMPSTPGGATISGFTNALVSFYNSFRFPSFIVERSETPLGESVDLKVTSTTIGPSVDTVVSKYGLAPPTNTIGLQEENGSAFRNFSKKLDVTGAKLLQGGFTGTYKFLDNDPDLVSGKAYYYRVRAYFGDVSSYLGTEFITDFQGDDGAGNLEFVKTSGNSKLLRFPNSSVVSIPSATARGFVPRTEERAEGFNPYAAIYDAVRAAILLNFEFPGLSGNASPLRIAQKTGWGTLSVVGGQVGPIKATFNTNKKLLPNLFFQTVARRISNNTINNLYSQPQLMNLLHNLWLGGNTDLVEFGGVSGTVKRVLESELEWKFIGVAGGITQENDSRIDEYLAREEMYANGKPLDGPVPVNPYDFSGITLYVTEAGRRDLAEFLRAALSAMSGQASYLSWYSVTLEDLFPPLVPFLFDFNQFMLAFLKAMGTAIQAIEDFIATILQKIRALEQILRTILSLIDLFDVNVRLSILSFSSTNGSTTTLANAILESTSKPASSPFGLHSGFVMTCGGPGEGSIAAFSAISFLLGLQSG